MSETITDTLQRIIERKKPHRNWTDLVWALDDRVDAESVLARLAVVRDAAEAIKARHRVGVTYDASIDDHVEVCNYCAGEGPCPDHLAAQAILDAVGGKS